MNEEIFVHIYKKNQLDIIGIIFISIPLLVFSVCRGLDVTPDTRSYFGYYSSIINNMPITVELSFVILAKICYLLLGVDSGFRGLLFCYSFISFLLLVHIIYKNSNVMIFSFLIYISIFYLSHICITIRTAPATLIFLWALEDIDKKKPLKYFLKGFLCVFFHTSGLLMFIVYPFIIFIINKKSFLFFIPIIGFSLSALSWIIIEYLIDILPGGYITYKLVAYFNMSQDNDFNEINVFNIYFLFTTIIYYFILLGYSVISNKMKIYHSVLCISVFFMYFGRNFAILSYRMPEFFNIVLVLLIPEIIKYVKEKWIVVITILCFCLFMIYYYTIRHPLINIASS